MSGTTEIIDIEDLNSQVEACTRCKLHQGTTHGVPGEGPLHAEIMLVGEAPGFNEDKQGRPFVGAAGRFLGELLAAAGLQRSDVYITNVVKHRPPDNRPPESDELLACRPYLDRQIALIQPKLIVTLGRFSLQTFFPNDSISRVHGQIRIVEGTYFCNLYHPAAALHQQSLRTTLLDDMRKLGEFISGPMRDHSPARMEPNEVEATDDPEQLTLF